MRWNRPFHLTTCLFSMAWMTGCVPEAQTPTYDDQGRLAPSQRGLDELITMSYEEMTEADIDRLNLLTGSMSSEEYTQKYELGSPDALSVDDITGAVWGTWEKVDIPGAVCSDGSQYKIFVMRSRGFINWINGNTKRLLVYLEPGGACWDYESCTGQTRRGAANPNGVPDNYMNLGDFINPNQAGGSPMAAISPLLLRNNPTGSNAKTAQWNKVFLPYCTGDVHSGNRVVTYQDPTGQNPPLTYRHVGAKNVELVIDYLRREFSRPNDMMITGCSAGGTGTLTNYAFFRDALRPRQSYMLNDSGPIFPAPGSGNHFPLHQRIEEAWGLDYINGKLSSLMPELTGFNDYGDVSTALADRYVNDTLAITLFKRDANYSAYSYARFFNLDEEVPAEKEQILQLWAEDIDNMVAQYDTRDNLSYFIPYMRSINESHCTSIIQWKGTEIENTGYDVGDYIKDVLKDEAPSYEEIDNPSDANVSGFWFELIDLLL